MHVIQRRHYRILWADALGYAYYLINRLPSSMIGGKTPVEDWSGRVAHDYDSLQIFGYPTYYHVKEDMLDPRARKAMFIGFKKDIKRLQILGSEEQKICLE